MKRKKAISFVLALSLAAVPVVLAGCSSEGGPLVATQTPEEALESAELSWGGYTMGIDYVTADQENMAGSELTGQGIRVVFRYIDGGTTGGFDGNGLFDLLDTQPIVLTDSSGNEYHYNDGITDITLVFSGNNLNISDSMPRFGIIFDVPAGTELGDYQLSVGDGSSLTLAEFITDAYAEWMAD